VKIPNPKSQIPNRFWLALMIGNSRLHWAYFVGETLEEAWDTDHLPASVVKQLTGRWNAGELPGEIFPPQWNSIGKVPTQLQLYVASVVPVQTELWQTYEATKVITLDYVPLLGLYPTLGVDRALALWGACQNFGCPVMVIDAGTALTFTGADANHRLVGGAIMPGLRLQLQSLALRTAALPEIQLPSQLPPRWALNTPAAIESGVVYTLLAGIKDFIEAWWQEFPGSRVVVTGGDRLLLLEYLQSQYPQTAAKLIADAHLIFWGMRSTKLRIFKEGAIRTEFHSDS
jgi:type III pantothenate kinase